MDSREEIDNEEAEPYRQSMKIVACVVTLVICVVLTCIFSFLIGYALAPERYKVTQSSKSEEILVKKGRTGDSIKEQINDWKHESCGLAGGLYCPDSYKKDTPLLIISMDGFRWDYLRRRVNPTLERMMKCGVHAPFMRPVFPSNTYPNLYSIVTGLYPESHGIIDDKIFDPEKEESFFAWKDMAYEAVWWGGEPIWTTAKKQGKPSAAIFWPGSNVKIQGHYPNKYIPHGVYMPDTEQVDLIVDWLTTSEDRPAVIAWYLDLPSRQGEVYGPDSDTLMESLQHLDSLFDQLMDALYRVNLTGCVNFVIVSSNAGPLPRSAVSDSHGTHHTFSVCVVYSREDTVVDYRFVDERDAQRSLKNIPALEKHLSHGTEVRVTGFSRSDTQGTVTVRSCDRKNHAFAQPYCMQSVSCDRIVHPLHHLEEHEFELVNHMEMFDGPIGRIRFTTSNITQAEIMSIAKHLACFSSHVNTYHKDDLPKRLHFNNNIRIEPIISIADAGWRTASSTDCDHKIKGAHGFDNKFSTMQTIFIAYGPAFHQQFVAESFENIELYNLFCELLRLKPSSNNGTKSSLSYLLKKSFWASKYDPQPITIVPREPQKDIIKARHDFSGCPCHQTVLSETEDIEVHLPWGAPYHKEAQILLPYKDYVISYDITNKQPRWVAFKMIKVNSQIQLYNESLPICWTAETLLQDNQMSTCSEFLSKDLKDLELSAVPLFPARYSSSLERVNDTYVLSNAVLMYEYFQSDIMHTLNSIIEVWFNQSSQRNLYVMLGPVFSPSYKKEGNTSLPVASDFFLILIRSPRPNTGQCDQLDVIAFLLPHRMKKSTCKETDELVYSHVVRLRDIELETGLQFFIGCSNKTASIQQRLKLSME